MCAVACFFTFANAEDLGLAFEEHVAAHLESLFRADADLAFVKLSIDNMIDQSVDVTSTLATIDNITSEALRRAGENAGSDHKLNALKEILYESGRWNGERPFGYDFSGPTGRRESSRLLTSYLSTRMGNCITMPMLMMFVGQRMGLDMSLAEAPLHLFIKYTHDGARTRNIEATSGGGFTRDVWYRRMLPMSEIAVENGIYLRKLSKEEQVAVIASAYVDHLLENESYQEAIAASDFLLRHYPNFAYLLVKKASAYSGLIRHGQAKDALMHQLQVKQWYEQNEKYFSKAEALGWDTGQ